MTFRVGIVGLCTSHPESWIPIIRNFPNHLKKRGGKPLDIKIVAAWDSGETREKGFTKEFCTRFNIPHPIENLDEMVNLVDGVFIHSANWDKHMEQAMPFIEAKRSVFIDKPIVGNLKEAEQLKTLIEKGARVTGGSALRFNGEIEQFLDTPEDKRGEIMTAFVTSGLDVFNYGVHAYSMALALMGSGVASVRYLGKSGQRQIQLKWNNNKRAIVSIGDSNWLPFSATVVTTETVEHIRANTETIYTNFLYTILPYFTGQTDSPPLSADELLEPVLIALAAKKSWQTEGREIFLTDLNYSTEGYDGTRFAEAYKRSRIKTITKRITPGGAQH